MKINICLLSLAIMANLLPALASRLPAQESLPVPAPPPLPTTVKQIPDPGKAPAANPPAPGDPPAASDPKELPPPPVKTPAPKPPAIPTPHLNAPNPQTPPLKPSDLQATPKTPTRNQDNISFSKSLALKLMHEELTRLQSAKATQLKDLTNAVKKLDQVLAKRKKTSPRARTLSTGLPTPSPETPEPDTVETGNDPTTDPTNTDETVPSPPATDAAATDSETHSPIAVTSTVNAISLADNLFAAGDTKTALRKYQALTKQTLPVAQKRWVIYQVASCYRRLGDIPAAEVIYRELAAEADDDTVKTKVPTHARWWLDALQRRKEAQDRLERVRFTIANMEQENRDDNSP